MYVWGQSISSEPLSLKGLVSARWTRCTSPVRKQAQLMSS
jgi:hypothetical protein